MAVGVPLPRGALRDAKLAAVVDATGRTVPSQHKALIHWPDGSIRWLLTEVYATVDAGERTVVFVEATNGATTPTAPQPAVRVAETSIDVVAGQWRFELPRRGTGLLGARHGAIERLKPESVKLSLRGVDGGRQDATLDSVELEDAGPVSVSVIAGGGFGPKNPLRFRARLTFYARKGLIKVELTLHNPNAALHVGNLWDLGDPRSHVFEDLTLQIRPTAACTAVRWRATPEASWQSGADTPWTLYQDSSGGDYWRSTNHVDASGELTVEFCGYQTRARGQLLESGPRAQPVVVAETDDGCVSATVECFWQNFPKGLRSRDGALDIALFPAECRAPFELQGGEEKRHTIWLQLSATGEDIDLDPAHAPLSCWVDSEYADACDAIPYLGTALHEAEPSYADYVGSIINGPRSFFENRELIDEYGWRHFGDLYADHEAVGWSGSKPMASHYNNQYDFIQAAGLNFLRTADHRWRDLCFDAARHMIDIDIYHTDRDRPAYNGGLFWHTEHYRDAATCTHRSYSRHNGSGSAHGGGPANEHNYTSGLLLYHCLSGDAEARRVVLGLANWVLAMDDGRQTVFGLFTDQPTGAASQTRDIDYHKPGRGAGNSINALLDAYLLSGQRKYLFAAEELIGRCIHPRDDVAALRFDDPENRWSYLAFLQVLGKYLDLKAEYGELDYSFYFARDSLLRYAEWMRQNEVPYRDVLHKVEIPTETWSAQDVRKAHIFHLAAKCSHGAERRAFAERAAFFAERCIADLLSFDTAHLTRPRVLIAGYEPVLTLFARRGYGPEDSPYARAHGHSFGAPQEFIPQRQIVKHAIAAKTRAAHRELKRLIRERWARVAARFHSPLR